MAALPAHPDTRQRTRARQSTTRPAHTHYSRGVSGGCQGFQRGVQWFQCGVPWGFSAVAHGVSVWLPGVSGGGPMGIQRGFQVVARSFSVVSRGFSVASRTAPSSFCTLLIIVSVLSRGCSVVSRRHRPTAWFERRHKSQRQRSPPRGASRHNSDATLRHNSQPPAILAEIAAFRRNSQRQRSRGMSEGRMGPNFNLIHRGYSCSSFGVPTFGVFLDGVRYPIRRRSCRA